MCYLGSCGIPVTFEAHSPQTRAAVVADFLAGKSKRAIARDHNVSIPTVRRWCEAATGLHNSTFQQAQVDSGLQKGDRERFHTPEPSADMADLWTPVFDLVVSLLNSASAVAKVYETPGWLERQNAHELGLFLSITVDKASGILEALERGYELKRRAQEAGLAGSPGNGSHLELSAPMGAN